MDELSKKNLSELEAFLDDLRRERREYPIYHYGLGDPRVGMQYDVLSEYDQRISRVNAEIVKRKKMLSELRATALPRAIGLLDQYATEVEEGGHADMLTPEQSVEKVEMIRNTAKELWILVEEETE